MPENIEIKTNVRDIDSLLKRTAQLNQSDGCTLHQEDTFFNTNDNTGEVRLKLREIKGDKAELISYIRSNSSEPKLSEYYVCEVLDPASLKKALEFSLGVRTVVRKCRTLFMVGQTRIHVDRVERLGDFMELEVVMNPGQSIEEGTEIAKSLMEKLDIHKQDLLTNAYADMLPKSGGCMLAKNKHLTENRQIDQCDIVNDLKQRHC